MLVYTNKNISVFNTAVICNLSDNLSRECYKGWSQAVIIKRLYIISKSISEHYKYILYPFLLTPILFN